MRTLTSMSEERYRDEYAFEPESFGVMCDVDLDAVLSSDEAAIRAWSVGVLSTALQTVGTWGSEANDLLHFAIRVLFQFSGGDEEISGESAILEWLNGDHPRGRQWSEFVELVPPFVERMNALWASTTESLEQQPVSEDDLPF
jgi:hypothetical protein